MHSTDAHPLARLIKLMLVLGLALGHLGAVLAQHPPLLWQINLNASSLNFSTTKSVSPGVGGITEVMRFKSFQGGLDAQGRIQLDIGLTSVDSGIALRDERLQTMLWNVASRPTVHFSAQLTPEDLRALQRGQESVPISVAGVLTMAGQSRSVQSQMQVTPMRDKLMVSTRQPIIVNADDFGLHAGVEALRAIMGLSFISTSVPVTFQLELVRAAQHARLADGGQTFPAR